ncbi:hypothetical protein CsSME_00011419 [Camellia sinensis var. sinensis]
MSLSRSRKIIENIRTEFNIQIEETRRAGELRGMEGGKDGTSYRRLPVGDGIWIARHKHLGSEYILDFIVERKNVDDLRCSIRDNRYRDQKLRLLAYICCLAVSDFDWDCDFNMSSCLV